MPPWKSLSPPETHQEMAVNVSMSHVHTIRYDFIFSSSHFISHISHSFLHSSGAVSLNTEVPENRNMVDSDNGGKQTGHHYDDGNSASYPGPVARIVGNIYPRAYV